MAVSKYVPKNIKGYKPKYFFGFTSRQLAGIGASLAVIVLTFMLLGDMDMEIKIYICSIPAVIPMALGFAKVYGMPLEEFVSEVITDHFLPGTQKRYRINAPSLRLAKKKNPLKLDKTNKPLAVIKSK